MDPEAAKYDFSRLVHMVYYRVGQGRKWVLWVLNIAFVISLEIAATGGAQITPAMEKVMSNLENLKAFVNVSIEYTQWFTPAWTALITIFSYGPYLINNNGRLLFQFYGLTEVIPITAEMNFDSEDAANIKLENVPPFSVGKVR